MALRIKGQVCSWLTQALFVKGAGVGLSVMQGFLPLEVGKKVLYLIVAHLSKGLEIQKLFLPHDSNF